MEQRLAIFNTKWSNEQLVGGASHQPAETSNRHPTSTTFLQELKMAVIAKVEEEVVVMIATPVESQKLRCVLVVDGNRYSPEDYPPKRKHIHTYPTMGKMENHRLKSEFGRGFVIVPWQINILNPQIHEGLVQLIFVFQFRSDFWVPAVNFPGCNQWQSLLSCTCRQGFCPGCNQPTSHNGYPTP